MTAPLPPLPERVCPMCKGKKIAGWALIETAPKDGTVFLAYGKRHGDPGYVPDELGWTGAYWSGSHFVTCFPEPRHSNGWKFTHWRPLPPLPVENFVDKDGLWDEKYGPHDAEQMQTYAKLAVREALERAEQRILTENNFPLNRIRMNTATDCAAIVRAMIGEYK